MTPRYRKLLILRNAVALKVADFVRRKGRRGLAIIHEINGDHAVVTLKTGKRRIVPVSELSRAIPTIWRLA